MAQMDNPANRDSTQTTPVEDKSKQSTDDELDIEIDSILTLIV